MRNLDISLALIRRCKANDEQAFQQLLQQYERALYRICWMYCQDQHEALDIMQEVYIKVFRFMPSFDESRPLMPWLKRIAINTCLNYQRNRSPIQGISLDGTGSPPLQERLAAADNVENTIVAKSEAELLRAAIQTLSSSQRMALTLHYIEGMDYRKIAETLDQPVGTVKSHLHRGRQQLRNILSKQGFLEV